MRDDALARSWKDPDGRDWPDDEHPAGQMYLHLNAIVGGFGDSFFDGALEAGTEPGSLTISSITSTGRCV